MNKLRRYLSPRFVVASQRGCAADAVFKFAHIAGEGACREYLDRGFRKMQIAPAFVGDSLQEKPGERRNVLDSLA